MLYCLSLPKVIHPVLWWRKNNSYFIRILWEKSHFTGILPHTSKPVGYYVSQQPQSKILSEHTYFNGLLYFSLFFCGTESCLWVHMLSGAQETWGVKSPVQEQRHSCQYRPPTHRPGSGLWTTKWREEKPLLLIKYQLVAWSGIELIVLQLWKTGWILRKLCLTHIYLFRQ